MAQYCNKCKLKEMIIVDSPKWANADVFKQCTLSMKVFCRVCNNSYTVNQTFNSLREYEDFLDKYKEDA